MKKGNEENKKRRILTLEKNKERKRKEIRKKKKKKQPHTTLCSLYLGMLAPPPFPVCVYHWPVSKQATPILQPYPVHSNLANSSSPFISACLSLVAPQPSHAPFLTQAAGDWWTLGKVKSYWWLLGKVNSYW